MADIDVRIMLPVDNRIVTVELEDSMTGNEVIHELIANNLLQPSDQGYKLAVKGGSEINATTQIKDLNLDSDSVIQIFTATDAG